MSVQIAELILLLAICLYTDLREQKIKNKFSVPLALLGVLTNLVLPGCGWANSLWGMVLPFAVFFLFFYLRMFRAGDIKAMMAIGAIMGYRFIGNAIFFIFGVGLLVSVFKMILYRNAKERLANLGRYFLLFFQTLRLAPYEASGAYDKSAHFPFSIAIAAGSMINLAAEYMGFYIFFH